MYVFFCSESIKDKVKKIAAKQHITATLPLLHCTSFGEWLAHCLRSIVKRNLSRTPAHAHISLPYPIAPVCHCECARVGVDDDLLLDALTNVCNTDDPLRVWVIW